MGLNTKITTCCNSYRIAQSQGLLVELFSSRIGAQGSLAGGVARTVTGDELRGHMHISPTDL